MSTHPKPGTNRRNARGVGVVGIAAAALALSPAGVPDPNPAGATSQATTGPNY